MTSVGHGEVVVEVEGGIATVVLNRSDRLNAMNLDMVKALDSAIGECAKPDIRAVVLTGKGEYFSVGGDLDSLPGTGKQRQGQIGALTRHLHSVVSRLVELRKPTLAAVNGTAAGAGLSLVTVCDLAIAVQTARFRSGYTAVGLTPDGGLSYFLPRLIGLRRASEMILTNRLVSAATAVRWGLINECVPDASFNSRVREQAVLLASTAIEANAETLSMMRLGFGAGLGEQLAREANALSEFVTESEAIEGILAFKEKRHPEFRGLFTC